MKNKDVERTITVEYSTMDFQWMIIGEKLESYTNSVNVLKEITDDPNFVNLPIKEQNEKIAAVESERFVFDDHYLSQMMLQPSIDFYLQDAIQKIIDYQFETTYRFFRNLAILYILGFITPLLVIIFYNDAESNKYCYMVGYVT